MVMDVPHMQRTRIGADFMTADPLNPKRCAVVVEVEQQVTYMKYIYLP